MSEPPADPAPFAPFELERSERIYDSPWCGLRRDWLRLADGARQEYHVFELADAVAVVPVLGDGSIVMLWQFRHPHRKTHWEVPAGRVDEGESSAVAAERELLEETGYRARELVHLGGFHPINGISAHRAELFAALGCEHVQAPKPGPCEKLSAHVLAPDDVRARLLRGEFQDGFTALALFHWFSSPRGARPTQG